MGLEMMRLEISVGLMERAIAWVGQGVCIFVYPEDNEEQNRVPWCFRK